MRPTLRTLLPIAILVLLGACGQKGELVRPPTTPEAPAPTAPAPVP